MTFGNIPADLADIELGTAFIVAMRTGIPAVCISITVMLAAATPE